MPMLARSGRHMYKRDRTHKEEVPRWVVEAVIGSGAEGMRWEQ